MTEMKLNVGKSGGAQIAYPAQLRFRKCCGTWVSLPTRLLAIVRTLKLLACVRSNQPGSLATGRKLTELRISDGFFPPASFAA